MDYVIERSGTGIERSGTGIERSGTGIERSGTGIERSGTGSPFKRAAMGLGAAIALASAFTVNAMEPQVLVTRNADSVLVSVHSGRSILVGSLTLQGTAYDYLSVNLYEATSKARSVAAGSNLLVHGTGGGTPGGSCTPSDSGLMVHGTGGGSSSDGESDCMNKSVPWGSAELVFDPAGTSIIVHRNGPTGPEEFMVEFVAATQPASTEFNPHSLPADTHSQPRQVAMH